MSDWLSDTNVVSELMRIRPNENVLKWAEQQEYFYLSVITIEEIYCGLKQKALKQKEKWFDRFVEKRCSILNIDSSIAKKAASQRGLFMANGILRSQANMLIAATAWKNQLTVTTGNINDFFGCGVPVYNPFD